MKHRDAGKVDPISQFTHGSRVVTHRDIEKINEILHFTHTIDSFATLFTELTEFPRGWNVFDSKTKLINPDRYLTAPDVTRLLHWMRKYIILIRFLDIRRYYVDELTEVSHKLHSPKEIINSLGFEFCLRYVLDRVKFFDQEVKGKTSRLNCTECVRLDEALVCYENYAYHSSVIMAVSAVEARITALLQKNNMRLYNSEFSKFTLGRLISVFDPDQFKDNKYKGIKKLMPDRHRPLVALLNQYRIFSAHPNGRPITAQIADSILNLSFAFMLDETTSLFTEKDLNDRHRIKHRHLSK